MSLSKMSLFLSFKSIWEYVSPIKQGDLYKRPVRSSNLSIILSAFANILSCLRGYVLAIRKQRRWTFNIRRSIFRRKMLTEKKILSDRRLSYLTSSIYLNYVKLLRAFSADKKIKRVGQITKNYENNITNLKKFYYTSPSKRDFIKCPLTIIKSPFCLNIEEFNFMNRESDKNVYNFASKTWMFLNSIFCYFISHLILEFKSLSAHY